VSGAVSGTSSGLPVPSQEARVCGQPGAGLYIHVPFCEKKCPYCDFYSLGFSEEQINVYTKCIIDKIYNNYSIREPGSVYFGGGTPSLLGAENLARILKAVRTCWGLSCAAEVTVEVNPSREWASFFEILSQHGVNRVSIGLQSAHTVELERLGRRHSVRQVAETVRAARRAGIGNLSLDLMLGIPEQTGTSLRESIAFCAGLDVQHVSAYLLKIEPGTVFDRQRKTLLLPDEETVCTLYETACEELERHGYRQYEISNFAHPGFESRHNLKYWRCEEYLGLGPSAHSFLNGRRFYFPRSLKGFLSGGMPVDDGPGGDAEEYVLLALRLAEGLQAAAFRARYGGPLPAGLVRKAAVLARAGFCTVDETGVRLTRKGFLLSNEVIAGLLCAAGF